VKLTPILFILAQAKCPDDKWPFSDVTGNDAQDMASVQPLRATPRLDPDLACDSACCVALTRNIETVNNCNPHGQGRTRVPSSTTPPKMWRMLIFRVREGPGTGTRPSRT